MFRPTFLLTTSLLTTSLLLGACATALQQETTYRVTRVADCPRAPSNTPSSLPLFNETVNLLTGSGWSHIHNPAKPVFAGLTDGQQGPLYNVPEIAPQPDPHCPQQRVYSTVLVKKYGNTENQHSNGLEPVVSGLRFGQIDSLYLELRVDKQHTKIPSRAQLKERFGAWLSETQLDQLDNQQVNFRVSFLGQKRQAPAEGVEFASEVFVTIDPKRQANQWLALDIPISTMKGYAGLYYRATAQPLADNLTKSLDRVQLDPETRGNDPAFYGKTAKNFMGDNWGKPNIPQELFKEYGISVRRMEIRLKP